MVAAAVIVGSSLLIMEFAGGLTLRMQQSASGRGGASEAAAQYLRLKRLKQITESEGGTYRDNLDETTRKGADLQRQAVVKCVVKTEEEMVEEMSRLRVAFLPDVGIDDSERWWYSSYYARLSTTTTFSPMEMPDPFALMSKRYEVSWLTYMRGLNLSSFDMVIAHGTSAEALLRLLESDHPVPSCVLIDASDIYTAGERHGRRFHFAAIRNNCPHIGLVSTNRAGKWSIYNTFSDELCGHGDGKVSSPIVERITAELKRVTCRG